jgi:hypothetical protein
VLAVGVALPGLTRQRRSHRRGFGTEVAASGVLLAGVTTGLLILLVAGAGPAVAVNDLDPVLDQMRDEGVPSVRTHRVR